MRAGLRAQLKNNRFQHISRQLKKREQEARVRAANVGASIARQLCPVSNENKEKHLIDTIAVYVGPAGGVFLIVGDNEITYAGFVNYGTVFIEPVPFFTKGTEAAKKQLPREYRRMRLR